MMDDINFIAVVDEPEIVTTVVFDAPITKVFEAFTQPDLFTQWISPKEFTTTIEKMDVRPGGAYRIIQTDRNHHTTIFNGKYRSVVPPRRFVYTFEYDDCPGRIVRNEVTFEEHAGKTMMTENSVYLSVADRDAVLMSGMVRGVAESMGRLAKLVELADGL